MVNKLSDYNPALKFGKPNADLGGTGTTGAPSYLEIVDTDGVSWFIFAETDGTVKIHTAVPTQDSDGSVVGAQT